MLTIFFAFSVVNINFIVSKNVGVDIFVFCFMLDLAFLQANTKPEILGHE